jgi:hypothetical protein
MPFEEKYIVRVKHPHGWEATVKGVAELELAAAASNACHSVLDEVLMEEYSLGVVEITEEDIEEITEEELQEIENGTQGTN